MDSLTPQEKRALILSVGSHRSARPLSPVEVAKLFHRAIEGGATLRNCADFVHLDGTSMVSRFLRLLSLPREVQQIVDWGQSGTTIAFTTASELARLKSPSDQIKVAHAILLNQLRASEVKELIQIHLRSGQPIEESIKSVIRLRPQVEQRHLFIGAITEPALRDHLAQMGQSERDQLLTNLIQTVVPVSSDFTVRLGTERFLISGDATVNSALASVTEDFEAWVNHGLVAKVKG